MDFDTDEKTMAILRRQLRACSVIPSLRRNEDELIST
jgi:hypothetical protein